MDQFTINSSNVKDISFLTEDFESNPIEITNNPSSQILTSVKSFGEHVLISGQLVFQGPSSDNDSTTNLTSTVILDIFKSSIDDSSIQTITIPSLSEDEMRIINIFISYKNDHVGFPNILNHVITFKTNQANETAFLKGYTLCFTQIDDNNIVNQNNMCQ